MTLITKENIIFISTTLSENDIAEKRRNTLLHTTSPFEIPVLFLHGIQEGPPIHIQYHIMKQRMETFQKLKGYEYAVLCDDDFHCHSRFLAEVNQTVAQLPPDWRCLHLCPGCLWGRGHFRHIPSNYNFQEGELYPEHSLEGLPYDSTGRVFTQCGSGLWNGKHLWLGGPIAVLVRKDTIDSLWKDYIQLYTHENNPNDVILTHILTNHDYVCRYPQLGYEKEHGGSCFPIPPPIPPL